MKPKLFKLISFVVFLSMVFTPVSAGPQRLVADNQQPLSGTSGREMEKIDPVVLSEIQSHGATDFFIWMAAQADLSGAKLLSTKLEKGQFVFERLRSFAEQTQKDLRTFLDMQTVDYQPFYIANTILVKAGDQNLLLDIAARPDVAAILPNRSYQLQEPFIIDPNPPQTLGVEPNITFIKATDVWAMGITGEGTVMAGGDTGLQWDHPAIKEHYRGWDGVNVDHNYNWWDATGTYPMIPGDGHGHGTHITGTMVGDDGGANQIGVAPGAKTIHCKNMTDWGGGDDGMFITCFQWILAPWDLNGLNPLPSMAPDSMNNSWGYWGGGAPQFETVISNLHAAGILVEVSAGNEGPYCGSLRSPGDYEQVLTTGSVNHASGVLPGTLTDWSSRGPSSLYPDDFFPDIMAPGENIRSSLPGNTYASWSGTSMAGPHAAALIGLMWSANPALAGFVEETIQMIKDTAVPLTGVGGSACGGDYVTGPNNDWGYGTIDALAAVNAAIDFGGTGTLQGTVTEAGSGDPIAGVKIMAVGPYNRSTTTNPFGEYSLLAPAGTYDVTASKYGYISQTFTSVEILEDQTYILDFVLELADFYNVSGLVTDINTGWPLYARIDITGFPYSPVWTDPQTGQYSVDLAGGFEYTFHVNAWVDGYLTSSRPVGPLSDDQIEDFELDVNVSTCTAPGYSPVYSFFEDFEAGYEGWSMSGLWNPQSESDVCGGMVAPFPSPDNASYYGVPGVCNFDIGYSTGSLTMVDPVSIPVAGGSLTYWSFEETECGGNCYYDKRYTEVSIDGGSTWNTIGEGHTEGIWHERWFNLTPYAGQNLLIRLRFDSIDEAVNYFFGWMVDDIAISTGCEPQAGSLIVGNVYDANTGLGLVNAVVSSDLGYATTTKATPLDPGVDDGFYTLFGPEGTNELTASKANYSPDSAILVVGDGETVRQDFDLAAGYLQLDPDSIWLDVLFGTSEILQIDLNNLGDVEAEFEIIEYDGGFIPVGAPVRVFVPAPAGVAPQGTAAAQSSLPRSPDRQAWSYLDSNQPAVGETDVLIVFADDGGGEPLRSILQAYPDIGVVDIWNAADWGDGIPSLETLLEYPIVITWSNYAYADRIAMGNVLADYVDAGGFVIQSPFSWVDDSWWGLGGRFVDEGYSPFLNINGGNHFNYSNLGDYDDTHPLMQGVTAASDFYRDIVALDPDATLVASWADGEEFVAYKDSVVAINSYTGFYYMWTGDVGVIFHNAVNFLVLGTDVPWLSADPTAGTVSPLDTQVIDVTLDASVPEITQPGLYNATLRFRNNTPYGPLDLPVTMNVIPTETTGKLQGTVSSMGYCDENPHPLAGANVLVESSLGMSWTLKTNAAGYYQLWLDESHSPLTITVTKPVYEEGIATGVIIVGQEITTVDFELRWLVPCMSAEPESLEVTLDFGEMTTQTVTLFNNGGGSADFQIFEKDLGYLPLSIPVEGQGEWLYQSQEGLLVEYNQGEKLLAYPKAYRWTSSQPTDIDVLIYADDYIHSAPNTFLDQALQYLGLSYTAHYDADFYGFKASLASQDWDIVLFGNDNWAPDMTVLDALNDYVSDGGKLIFHSWTVSWYPGSPLWTTLGINWVADDYDPPDPVYWWDPSHPIFTNPQSVPEFTDLQPWIYGTYGQRVEPMDSFEAIAGYTTPGPDPNQAAMVLSGDSRTVFKGFLDGHNSADLDGDGLKDGVELWINLIDGIQYGFAVDLPWLSSEPEQGTIMPDSSLEVEVTFDAGAVDEPGQFFASLDVRSNDPVRKVVSIPVSMTVIPLPTTGKLDGIVTSLGYCDGNPAPLKGAEVLIESSLGESWTVMTNADGYYYRWLDEAGSPYTLSVSAVDHQGAVTEGIIIIGQQTTTQDFSLRWLKPCLNIDPDSFSVNVPQGHQITLPWTLINSGAGSLDFSIFEKAAAPGSGFGAVAVSGSSAKAPAWYQPELSQSSFTGKALGGTVAIFKDLNPWDSTAVENILGANGISYEVHPSAAFGTLDFSDYGMIVISGDQPQWFYDAYANYVDKFEQYVQNGGFLNFFACDWGWNGGGLYAPLPGGMTWNGWYFEELNQIEDPDHPVVQGVPNPFWGSFASHGHFSNLPAEAHTIAREYYNNMPTIVEYSLGAGWMVAFGQPLEISYDWGWDAGLILVNTLLWGHGFEPWEDIPWLTQNPETGLVSADSSFVVEVTFAANEDMPLGEYQATMVLLTSDPVNKRIEIPVTMTVVEVEYGVELSAEVDAITDKPGETVAYTLTLTNTGNITDTFEITSAGNIWDVHLSETSFNLAAGESVDFVVHVTIPAEAEDGDFDLVTVTATSTGDEDQSASVTLTTTALVPQPDVFYLFIPLVIKN